MRSVAIQKANDETLKKETPLTIFCMSSDKSDFMENAPEILAGGSDQLFDAGLSKWLESFDDQLLLFEHSLRNEFYDENLNNGEGGWAKIPGAKRKINEEGIKSITEILRMLINRNTYMSYLRDDSDVNQQCKTTLLKINDLLFINFTKWQLTLDSYVSIMLVTRHVIEFAFKRARRGAERDFLRGTTRESRNIGMPRSSKGFTDYIPGMGGSLR